MASPDGAIMDFDAVASLPCCTSLSILVAPDGGELSFFGRMGALSGCSTLTHVRLCSLPQAPLEQCLELAIAPQMRVLEVHDCTFDKELSLDALATSLRAVARRREGFDVVVQQEQIYPAPGLLSLEMLHN
jgi:hypothetical protein